MKKHILKLGLFFVIIVGAVFGQTTVSIPDTTVSKGELVLPVNSGPLEKVGSITLNISYDVDVLDFNPESGVANSPFVPIDNLLVNANNGVISIGWFSATPVDVTDKLLDLIFTYKGGNSNVAFTGTNEITNDLAQAFDITFVDGSVGTFPATLKLGEATGSKGDTVSIALDAKNLENLGSFTLFLSYDKDAATFLEKTNDILNTTIFDDGNGNITIGWFDTTPFSVADETIMNLSFVVVEGATDVSFGTNSEVTDIDGNAITVNYNDGKVSQHLASLTIPEVRGNAGEEVTIPINGLTLSEIGSYTLKINYSSDILSFVSAEDLTGGNLVADALNGVLTIGYFNATGFSENGGAIAYLKFNYSGGMSNLTFNTADAEVTEVDGDNITSLISFVNGKVTDNSAPVLADPEDATVAEKGTLEIVLSATDADGDAITYEVINNPEGSSLTDSVFTWVPDFGTEGEYNVTFVAKDELGGTDSSEVKITVTNTNQAPEFTAELNVTSFQLVRDHINTSEIFFEDKDGNSVSSYTFQYEASDADGEDLTFSLVSGPTGATVSETGLLTLLPSEGLAGTTVDVEVKVTDGIDEVTSKVSVSFLADIITDILDLGIPVKFTLDQNYPNPFNPATLIRYGLPKESDVVLKVYNILGEEVRTLVNTVQQAGWHEVNFEASQLTSGLYIYRIEATDFVEIKKMMLIK